MKASKLIYAQKVFIIKQGEERTFEALSPVRVPEIHFSGLGHC